MATVKQNRVKQLIEFFGWVLFGCLYSGLIVLFLWWMLETQNGVSAWVSLSVLGKILVIIAGVGGVAIYTIVMFFVQMVFESLWIWLMKKIVSIRSDIKKMRDEVKVDNVKRD